MESELELRQIETQRTVLMEKVLVILYLACPDPGDQIPIIPEDVEYLQDPSRVAKHRDAGVRDGQV